MNDNFLATLLHSFNAAQRAATAAPVAAKHTLAAPFGIARVAAAGDFGQALETLANATAPDADQRASNALLQQAVLDLLREPR